MRSQRTGLHHGPVVDAHNQHFVDPLFLELVLFLKIFGDLHRRSARCEGPGQAEQEDFLPLATFCHVDLNLIVAEPEINGYRWHLVADLAGQSGLFGGGSILRHSDTRTVAGSGERYSTAYTDGIPRRARCAHSRPAAAAHASWRILQLAHARTSTY